ncbi:MAG: bifunctional phosphoribosylaminoimidazolecarboxamide formyltransferase/IMP cyclohydrolase [Bacillota bacterium]
MKRALVSVSDKTGVIEFCENLTKLGYEIISTGGTKAALENAGVPCISISDVTGFPEICDGRVKTLHPNVHGGLLARRCDQDHMQALADNNIELIDLVCVNLYPFKQTIANPNVKLQDAIENIDIGGPSMLRSAAKNFESVTVVCDASDYAKVLSEIAENGDTTPETRFALSAKVFRHTASYDAMISTYLTKACGEEKPESVTMAFEKDYDLRYGENPHQSSTLYKTEECGYSLVYGKKLHGKELSYNNIQDGNATLNILKEFDEPCCVAVKHMNPCGVGVGETLEIAWKKAYEADTVSIFGGIVAFNGEVSEEIAKGLSKVFLEIIMAPSFSAEALAILTKKKNIRLMEISLEKNQAKNQFVSVNGGVLIQEVDNAIENPADWKVVTKTAPTAAQIADFEFGMKVCKHVKSNAIVVVKNGQTLGVGAGQMNRVGSCEIALECAKAKGVTEGLILASDAFFPFDDCVELAKKYNVEGIVQPGGSIRDEDSIKKADEYEIPMMFTGIRHFKH